jgi:putative endonuclease
VSSIPTVPAPPGTFHYVYILQSVCHPSHLYMGRTEDLTSRLLRHNSGQNPHTTAFRPWLVRTAIAFRNPSLAAEFEQYLKSHSGRAFAKKHL